MARTKAAVAEIAGARSPWGDRPLWLDAGSSAKLPSHLVDEGVSARRPAGMQGIAYLFHLLGQWNRLISAEREGAGDSGLAAVVGKQNEPDGFQGE